MSDERLVERPVPYREIIRADGSREFVAKKGYFIDWSNIANKPPTIENLDSYYTKVEVDGKLIDVVKSEKTSIDNVHIHGSLQKK